MAWFHGSVVVLCLFLSLSSEGVRQCVPGRYGESCELLCPRHCAPQPGSTVGDCDRVTGRCYEGCDPGWYGDHCSQTCSKTCKRNICNRDNGHCTLGCTDNYLGDFCREALSSEGVRQCVPGRCGESCELLCPRHCAPPPGSTVGDCDRVTGRCYEGCAPGWYGDHCSQTCSKTCKGNICNRDNGHCTLGCTDNYLGDFCSEVLKTDGSRECLKGRYGSDCLLPCPAQCWSNPLDPGRTAGRCDGDTGVCGDGCHRGWYGDHCNHTCSRNCKDNICSQGNGHCTLGCTGKYPGDVCTEVTHQGKKWLYSITITVTVLVLMLLVILVLVILSRRRRVLCDRRQKSMLDTHQSATRMSLLSQNGLDEGTDTVDRDLQTLDTPLHSVCRKGKLQGVTHILDQSLEDINKKGRGGMTPVMWAARRGHRDVVDLLVKKGADVSLKDDKGYNILHWACFGCHFPMVQYVLSLDRVDIHSAGADGRTPLMWEAQQGNKKMFYLLVHKVGLPSQVDRDGNNILLLACLGGNVKIVEYILSHGDVDINGRGQSGKTPSMAAAYKGYAKIFDLLVNKGADLTLVDDAGDNVLHVACLKGHVDIVRRVLKQNTVDINSQGQYNRTPLIMAARRGMKEIFYLLVTEGPDASLVDDDGNNILHLACKGGHLDIVKYILLKEIVDINSRNKHKETAAMLSPKGSKVSDFLVSHIRFLQEAKW